MNFPTKRYSIIYADPPWEYAAGRSLAKKSLLSGEDHSHYMYMSHEELCSLPVGNIAEEKCLLFMWVTGPKLNEAFEVGSKWGFDYSTIAFVWEKQRINPGYYTLSSVELCLVFRKNGIPLPRGKRNVREFLSQHVDKHSKKPEEVRNRITLMFPTQRKIELFARCRTEGWDAWGNEVE